jgi:predicted ATPase
MKVEGLSNSGYNKVLTAGGEKEKDLAMEWLYEQGDRIHNPVELRDGEALTRIEVMGMPGAGKSTLLARVEELGIGWLYCGKEPYSVLKQQSMKITQEKIWGAMLGEMVVATLELRRRGMEWGGVAILDRGARDYTVMTDAKYRNGEMIGDEWARNLHKLGPMHATIVMMVSPVEAYRRISLAGRVGGHSTLEFLTKLYGEYVSDIFWMVKEKVTNLVVMKMEGDMDGNVVRFRQIVGKIVGKEV